MSEQLAAEAAPLRPRRWLRSLTSKLVVGVVSLVVVLVTLISGLTWYAFRAFLLNQLDQQVAPVAQFNQRYLQACLPLPGSCNIAPSNYRAAQIEWIAMVDRQGQSVLGVPSGLSVRAMDLSGAQRKALFAKPGDLHSLTTTDGIALRVSARPISVEGSPYVVVTGLSLDNVDGSLHRLVVIEAIIGGSAIILAFGATFWGVQRSLANLYKVTGTARDVTAELSSEGAGLDRRVPVVEEGTEVGQLAESVNTLLTAVEHQFAARVDSEQRMRQFLADASHELRTPLTSIRGFAELARMQRAAGGDVEDNLERIESEGTRMSRLVEDLLLLARNDDAANTRALQREPVEIAGLLDDVARSTRAAFPERRVEVEAASTPLVLGDRDQLLRVVRNLATNACVHTRPDAPVLLRSSVDTEAVYVQVIDGGPGLPPEEAQHVFERFWRADKARTRARGGSGLGLSIVATIVRAHGGNVRFDSAVDTGSTVTVRLPLAPDVPGETVGPEYEGAVLVEAAPPIR